MRSRSGVTLACLIVVFVLDQSMYTAITPLLPELREAHHLSGNEIGILAAAYPFGLALMSVPGGQLAARWGARPIVVVGALLLALSSVGFGYAPGLTELVAMRFMQGVSAALTWGGGLAWASTLGRDGRQGTLIGTLLSAAVVGTVIGPTLGAIAAYIGRGPAFVVIAVAAGSAAGLLWFRDDPEIVRGTRLLEVSQSLVRRPVLLLTWINVLCAMLIGALVVVIPLRLSDFGVSSQAIGVLWVLIAVVEIIGSPLVGRLHDRYSARLPLLICIPATIAALIGLMFAHNAVIAGAWAVLAVPASALLLTPALAGIGAYAARIGLSTATVFGFTNLLWAIGEAVGAFAAGASDPQYILVVLLAILAGSGYAALRVRPAALQE